MAAWRSLLVVRIALVVCTISMPGSARRPTAMPSFAGPYIVYLERLYPCEGVQTDDGSWVRCSHIAHFNPVRPFDHQLISCNISLDRDLEDSFWVESRVASWSNNQWKANALVFSFPRGLCSTMRMHAPQVFRSVLGDSITRAEPCRVPAGDYFFNRTLDWTFPYFPVLPYGRYRAQIKVGSPPPASWHNFA